MRVSIIKIRILFTSFFFLSMTVFLRAQTPKEPEKTKGGYVLATDRFPPPPLTAGDRAVGRAAALRAAKLMLPLEETFELHSNADSTKVIYLDFDGHHGEDGTYAAFSFQGGALTLLPVELLPAPHPCHLPAHAGRIRQTMG